MIQNIRPIQPIQSRQNFGQLRMENTRAAEIAVRVACEMDSRLPRTLQRIERDQANVHSAHIILDGDNSGQLLIKIQDAASGAIQNIRDFMKHDPEVSLEWDVTDDSEKLSLLSKHILRYDTNAKREASGFDSDFDF